MSDPMFVALFERVDGTMRLLGQTDDPEIVKFVQEELAEDKRAQLRILEGDVERAPETR